jgi:hypothetical protein
MAAGSVPSSVWDYATKYYAYVAGHRFLASLPVDLPGAPGSGAVRAIQPGTGDIVREYKLPTKPQSGILSTAGREATDHNRRRQRAVHVWRGRVVAGPA